MVWPVEEECGVGPVLLLLDSVWAQPSEEGMFIRPAQTCRATEPLALLKRATCITSFS